MTDSQETWNRETIPRVVTLLSPKVPQRDLHALLLVSPWCYRALVAIPSLWETLDLHGRTRAGDRLLAALSLPRYSGVVREINLEFAQGVEDSHLVVLAETHAGALRALQSLNLNGCQKVTDKGIETVSCACPDLRSLSIYWNVRVSDAGVAHVASNCERIRELNLSGCRNITDRGLHLIAESYGSQLLSLNLTRCGKLTDAGMKRLLGSGGCSLLKSLNLYALSGLTDESYKEMGSLEHLEFLDLCGAQNLSDAALSSIAAGCGHLTSLNLTWCVRLTDAGVVALAEGCRHLEFLSLFGIVGVSDASVEALAKTCSKTLHTLDVNGCIGIKRRSREELLRLFPNLKCFKVHS